MKTGRLNLERRWFRADRGRPASVNIVRCECIVDRDPLLAFLLWLKGLYAK